MQTNALFLFSGYFLGTIYGVAAPQNSTSVAAGSGCQAAVAPIAKPVGIDVAGPEGAAVTIVVFSDFESFSCARSASVLAVLVGKTRNVRLIFKHAPSASNDHAVLAYEAALAAGAQDRFWDMHDMLFENQSKLSRAGLLEYARTLGLNLPAFQQALDNHAYRPIVERDLAEARGFGVTTTPTFFVNGRRLIGPQGYGSLDAVIETVVAGIPKSERVQEQIVASGAAQAIDLEHAP